MLIWELNIIWIMEKIVLLICLFLFHIELLKDLRIRLNVVIFFLVWLFIILVLISNSAIHSMHFDIIQMCQIAYRFIQLLLLALLIFITFFVIECLLQLLCCSVQLHRSCDIWMNALIVQIILHHAFTLTHCLIISTLIYFRNRRVVTDLSLSIRVFSWIGVLQRSVGQNTRSIWCKRNTFQHFRILILNIVLYWRQVLMYIRLCLVILEIRLSLWLHMTWSNRMNITGDIRFNILW